MPSDPDEDLQVVVNLIDAYCHLAGVKKANEQRQKAGELLLTTRNEEVYVEPEYAPGQVEFLAEVVIEVLSGFGWVEPDWQPRWALFGEDFERHDQRGPGWAYRMEPYGGVPSFWTVLMETAVKKGIIPPEAIQT